MWIRTTHLNLVPICQPSGRGSEKTVYFEGDLEEGMAHVLTKPGMCSDVLAIFSCILSGISSGALSGYLLTSFVGIYLAYLLVILSGIQCGILNFNWHIF